MRVMVANNDSALTKRLAHEYPHRIGWLQGPSKWMNPQGIAYALDNDAFISWTKGITWDESAWLKMLDKAASKEQRPLWCLLPDSVGNKDKTIELWHKYYATVDQYGFAKAFAVQDGMTPADVPRGVTVVFVGGTTLWKWRNLTQWTDRFTRVHVGRVYMGKLLRCHQLGVESCDSSGWFRKTQHGRPARYLKDYVEGCLKPHPELLSA